MFRTVLLLLCFVTLALATELNGSNKKKKRQAELQAAIPVIVGPTKIPEGIALCQGTCGRLNKCQRVCEDNQKEYDNGQCLFGCKCCGPRELTGELELPDLNIGCSSSPCGNNGKCRKDCATFDEIPIFGSCRQNCMCCSGNNTLPIRDCTFNGKTYKDGEQVEGICVNLICRSGQWASTGNIDECCRKCNVKDDPHFVSYDGVAFDFHGTCNYSITQEGVTQNPPFGVFGDFRTCLSSRSCVDATTFKDNENTIISMTYAGMANVAVNGNPFTVTTTIQNVAGHPVLAWRVGDCIRFLGTQRLMVEYCWEGAWRQVYLYAHPALTDRLYGLCGHYNYYTPDDLTHRDLSVTAPTFLPNAFGNSWKTSVQADLTCLSTPVVQEPIAILSRQKRQDGIVVDPCWNETYAKCYEILSTVEYNGNYPTEEQLQINSMFCATDLCAFKQAGNNQSDIDGYIRAIIEMLKTTVMYDAMATPGAAPIKDVCLPCLGTCGDGGNCRFQCDSSEEESGWCPFKKCKCCKKKPTCEDFTCGEGGTCRSCSCMEGEEVISGQCPMEGCLCCKKKTECDQRCGKRNRYRCKPIKQCKRRVGGKCKSDGCTCCKRWVTPSKG